MEGETISGGTIGDILETKCGKKYSEGAIFYWPVRLCENSKNRDRHFQLPKSVGRGVQLHETTTETDIRQGAGVSVKKADRSIQTLITVP